MYRSRGGHIGLGRKFDRSEVDVLVGTKQEVSWISSSQQEAVIQLLVRECGAVPELKTAVKKLMIDFEIFRPDNYKARLKEVLLLLISSCGFNDEKNDTAIFGVIEKMAADGCSIPANLIRSIGVYSKVSPMLVNVNWSKIEGEVTKQERNLLKIKDIANSIVNQYGNNLKNIILIDDFIGTGSKIIRYLRAIYEAYPDARVFVISILGLQTGIDNLTSAKEYCNFGFYILQPVEALNGSVKITAAEIDLIEKFESNVLGVTKDYVCGYKNSKALCVISGHAASNNVFPLFWHLGKEKDRSVLFGR